MGHFVFICLHLIAMLFFAVALFVTVPLHVVYSLMAGRSSTAKPTPRTHVKCPDCQELVLKEARKCKHCGASLVPST